MKKLLLLSISLCLGMTSMPAQDLIYRSYGGGQSQQPASQSRVVQTTAYYSLNGNFYKAPIRVEITSGVNHYGGTSYYVVAEYRSTGYSGQWQNLINRAYVQTCNPYLSSDNLESSFMYKANVNGKWYYFDL